MAPGRGSTRFLRTGTPAISERRRATSLTEVAVAEPTLMICPATGRSPASSKAVVRSPIYRKSRVWAPSPKISMPWFAAIDAENFAITLAYGDVGSCRGPYALKIRTTTVSIPFREAISSQANSPTIFEVAYGDAGAGRIVSTFGFVSEFPYTAALEANTTRRTFASTAALRTARVPWTFVRQYASGCATLSGTEVLAARW